VCESTALHLCSNLAAEGGELRLWLELDPAPAEQAPIDDMHSATACFMPCPLLQWSNVAPGIVTKLPCPLAGLVLLDECLLRSAKAMWQLGVLMNPQAGPGGGQPPTDTRQKALLTVLPVVLVAPGTVLAAYEQHWTPARTEAARSEGLPPATLADVQRLLALPGITQRQVHGEIHRPRLIP